MAATDAPITARVVARPTPGAPPRARNPERQANSGTAKPKASALHTPTASATRMPRSLFWTM